MTGRIIRKVVTEELKPGGQLHVQTRLGGSRTSDVCVEVPHECCYQRLEDTRVRLDH